VPGSSGRTSSGPNHSPNCRPIVGAALPTRRAVAARASAQRAGAVRSLSRLKNAITPTTGMTAKADSDSASRGPGRCFGSDLLMSPQSCDQQDQGDDLGNYHSRNQYRQ
jgi:hypothetical protein